MLATVSITSLLGLEPEEILPRLQNGDPLNIQEACVQVLRCEASLIDPSRLFEHALIEVAFDASLCSLEDLHPDWMDNSIHRALARLISRDQREEQRGIPENWEDFEYIKSLFLLGEDKSGRTASVRYHALPQWMRQAFYALLMRDVPPDECVARGLGTRQELRHACWSVFVAVDFVTEEEYAAWRRKRGLE